MSDGDPSPARRVLVVGPTVAGLGVAGLLRRFGHEVVVVAGRPSRVSPGVVAVSGTGLTLLDRLGAGEAVRAAGDRLEPLRVRGGDGSATRTLSADGGEAPLLVGARQLRDALADRFAVERDSYRDLTRLRPDGDGLVAEFDERGGREERFDVVVGADGPRSHVRTVWGHDDVARPNLVQYVLPADGPAVPERPTETWGDDALAEVLPAPPSVDARALVRVTAVDRPRPGDVATGEAARGTLRRLDADLAAAVREGPGNYEALAQADGPDGAWRTDRLAFCGAAAYPVAPATGLGVSLALEEGWTLAAALAEPGSTVGEALDAFATRRRRRAAVLHRAARRTDADYPPTAPGRLGVVARLRSLGLGDLLGGGRPPAGDRDRR